MEKPHVSALVDAIGIAGNQSKLAEGIASFLGRPTFKQQTVSYWITKSVLLDPEYWPAIEHVTGGKVTRKDLRPDVFNSTEAA